MLIHNIIIFSIVSPIASELLNDTKTHFDNGVDIRAFEHCWYYYHGLQNVTAYLHCNFSPRCVRPSVLSRPTVGCGRARHLLLTEHKDTSGPPPSHFLFILSSFSLLFLEIFLFFLEKKIQYCGSLHFSCDGHA